MGGKRAFIDSRYRKRSRIEAELIELMEDCWRQRPSERPSIFEAVTRLKLIKAKAITAGTLETSALIKIP